MNPQLDSQSAKVLLYLAEPENRGQKFELKKVLAALNIPLDQETSIYQKIWFGTNKYVVGEPAINKKILGIAPNGINSIDLFEDIVHKERVMKFPSFCNKILRFITRSKKTYNTEEISNDLAIDYDVVEAVADKFSDMGLVQLSITSGHYNLHVMDKAHRFFHESFFEQDGKYSTVSIGNYINAPQNKGIIMQDSPLSGDENQINQNPTS